jgi:hypothetical protein
MAAHCETGKVSALLDHKGLTLAEPMVFGIGAGIFFAYLDMPSMPFPTFAVRTQPGVIPRKVARRIGADFCMRRFRSPDKAMRALDELVDRGVPAAVGVDLFHMDYFPPYTRVHFNGHFVMVVDRTDTGYTISDVYHPEPAVLSREALARARFARGMLAPKGLMFHVARVPGSVDLRKPVVKGIREAARNMVMLPVPFIGVRGIRLFARKVTTWPARTRDIDHLSHEIMKIHIALEDQGTGGGGFRFMFATFLQQAANLLGNEELAELSRESMRIGDAWREISLFVARIGKKRDLGPERLRELSGMIMARADDEQRLFGRLLKTAGRIKV